MTTRPTNKSSIVLPNGGVRAGEAICCATTTGRSIAQIPATTGSKPAWSRRRGQGRQLWISWSPLIPNLLSVQLRPPADFGARRRCTRKRMAAAACDGRPKGVLRMLTLAGAEGERQQHPGSSRSAPVQPTTHRLAAACADPVTGPVVGKLIIPSRSRRLAALISLPWGDRSDARRARH
jgi:hypothetical protein